MEKKGTESPDYFREALTDFVHDAASGGAIRHLVDLGYTTDQIMEKLDFPTPRARVEKTVYRYMLEKKILLEKLPEPEEEMRLTVKKGLTERMILKEIRKRMEENGEENSYLYCFGDALRDGEIKMTEMLSCLTAREREYLQGIPWERPGMYHRLNSRMLEIGVQMAAKWGEEWKFFFLRTKEIVAFQSTSFRCQREQKKFK